MSLYVTEQHRGQGAVRRFGRAVERTVDAILENAYNVDRMLLLERSWDVRGSGRISKVPSGVTSSSSEVSVAPPPRAPRLTTCIAMKWSVARLPNTR